jgi:tetratricopeptide (TPR) repeat protein
MIKTVKVLALVICLAVLASCGQETADFNTALDADRDAREKMRAAIAGLQEYSGLLESDATEEERSAALESARNAYQSALDSWKSAASMYAHLKDLPNAHPDYLNNFGNMLYYQYRQGIPVDLAPAEEALNKAIEIDDRKIYQDNLAKILAVQGKGDNLELSERDAELEEIRLRNAELLSLLK